MKARVDDRPDEEELEAADVAEHGRTAEGETTSLDRRLFMQLQAFGGAGDPARSSPRSRRPESTAPSTRT